jgi:hypothetical protein
MGSVMKGNEEAARGGAEGAGNHPLHSSRPSTSDRPVHPRAQAIVLVIAVVVVIVFLASISTFSAR